jgi:hypothetical protein
VHALAHMRLPSEESFVAVDVTATDDNATDDSASIITVSLRVSIVRECRRAPVPQHRRGVASA